MPTLLHPTAELVAVYWLKGVEGLPVDQINTTLPEKNDDFAANGFVQVSSLMGSFDFETYMQSPVIQVDCWAYNANSLKVPWGKANQLAEIIKYGTRDAARTVTLPGNYAQAMVRSVLVRTDVRRVTNDEDFARYSMDLVFNWTEFGS